MSEKQIDDSRVRQQKYKSEICKYWENSNCPYGPRCIYAHGSSDLRNPFVHRRLYKTKHCASWAQQNCCPYGAKCQFQHPVSDIDLQLWRHSHRLFCEEPGRGNRLPVFRTIAGN